MLEYRDIYAGGRLVCSGSPDVITIVNPATEEVVGAVPAAVGTGINLYEPDLGSPWGGPGSSGTGSAYGPEGMDPYLTSKSVFLPTAR